MGGTHLHPLFQIRLPPVLKDGTPRLLAAEIAVFEHLFVIDRLRCRRQIPWHHLHKLDIYQLRTGTERQILAASGDVIRVQTVLEQSAQPPEATTRLLQENAVSPPFSVKAAAPLTRPSVMINCKIRVDGKHLTPSSSNRARNTSRALSFTIPCQSLFL